MIDPQGAETGPAYQTLGHIDALPAGTMLGEFEIQALLGFGGFGMVYRGYDRSLQRAVAIKEYMPSALVARGANLALSARSSADSQSFQSGLKSFISEARLLARFDHPSLVKVYRFWEANNTAYMAMPLYQGITLKQARLQMSGPPPEDWLRVVLWSVLEALKVLHSSDALHRDVSPDNIFLQDTGPPVLLDLGAARLAVMEANKKHTAVLKVNYAPIEQYADVSDLREGPWTDIYALAAVIHGCICNEPPLPATFRVVRDRLPAMAKIAKTTYDHFGQSYSSTFVKAIDQALAVQPGDRPQSVDAFAKALRLHAVSQSERFDWRTALGDKLSLSADGLGAEAIAFGASATAADTVPFANAQSATTKPASVGKRLVPVPLFKAGSIKLWWWAVGVGVLVLLAILLIRHNRVTSEEHFAVPQPTSATATASTPGVSPQGEVHSPQATAASEPAVPALVPLAVQSEPVASPVAKVQPPKIAPARQIKPNKPPQDHAAVVGKSTADASDPSVVKQPKAQEPTRVADMPKPKRDNLVLCAETNLFTRPMCIYRECQKPEFKNLQICIEDRKRWEERDKQTRP